MKILITHNNYGKYSGEEAVVDRMALMFNNLGYEVAQLRMTTANSRDSLKGKMHAFVSGMYCPSGVKAMREIIERENPDIVNVHNLYPFISPAALRECKKAGKPVVMTIHNFRLICPTGLFMRNSKPCELCLEKGNEWSCVKYNCENSKFKSIGYAARNAIARLNNHYKDCVDYYACITDFQRRKLIEAGFKKEKLLLIPNSVDVIEESIPPTGEYVGFCGRLSYEKGIDLILDVARKHPEIPFKLAGECRDVKFSENLPTNVELMGYLEGNSLSEFYRKARFLIMASRWYEGFPMSILEAAQHYKPTVGPDHGGFTEIIGKDSNSIGRLFRPGDANALEIAILDLWKNQNECFKLGKASHDKLINEFSTSVISRKWDSLFKKILTLQPVS